MYPVALDAGITAREFWDMSLMEIFDRVESSRRTREIERKQKISQDFVLAQAIASRITFFFTDEKDRSDDMVLEPWDAYPDLFNAEKEQVAEANKVRELEEYKAAFKNFAARVNATRKQANNGS